MHEECVWEKSMPEMILKTNDHQKCFELLTFTSLSLSLTSRQDKALLVQIRALPWSTTTTTKILSALANIDFYCLDLVANGAIQARLYAFRKFKVQVPFGFKSNQFGKPTTFLHLQLNLEKKIMSLRAARWSYLLMGPIDGTSYPITTQRPIPQYTIPINIFWGIGLWVVIG